jgi:hypothetical protein
LKRGKVPAENVKGLCCPVMPLCRRWLGGHLQHWQANSPMTMMPIEMTVCGGSNDATNARRLCSFLEYQLARPPPFLDHA